MAEARRKTTIEECQEIVEYCLKHNRDYKGIASIYDVSYSQVYSWVKKYDASIIGILKKRASSNFTYEVQNGDLYSRQYFKLFNISIYYLFWI